MEGIKNFLFLVYTNWTTIIVIIGLLIGLYGKIKSYLKLSKQEKIDLAWKSVRSTILSMVTDAELNYADWRRAGDIKRSEVIKQIFTDYPILTTITDRDTVEREINKLLDQAIDNMKNIFENNADLIEGIGQLEVTERSDDNGLH